ncbi:MAG TPA: SDR family oxidoreductase [Thermoanaerobaculia bacterium]
MILVTGATGKVGQEVVRQLAAANVPVRALVRDPLRASHIRLPGVEIGLGDLAKPETLDAAMDGVERVFLLSSPDPDQVNLQSNVIDAARRMGVRHVVKASVAGGPDSGTQIGRWHWTTETQLKESGLAFTILRPSFYMQQLLLFAPTIAATGAFQLPMGAGAVAVVDTRDVAAVAVCALTQAGHESRIYDLTGPEALTFDEMADELSRATGKKIAYVHVPPDYARKHLLQLGLPRWLVDDMIVLCASFRDGYGAAVSTAVRDVTHRAPRTFAEFAHDYASLFREGR